MMFVVVFSHRVCNIERVAPGEDKKSNPVAPGSYNIGEDLTKVRSISLHLSLTHLLVSENNGDVSIQVQYKAIRRKAL